MSTRGCYGFYKNKIDKLTYNHFDSYFEGLGNNIVQFIRNTSIEQMNKIFEKIELVNEMDIPTVEQVLDCQKYINLSVSTQSVTDMYCLLRETQGYLEPYRDTNLKWMINSNNFIKDSLFCEYAYIINLDTNQLEIYTGFNKVKTNNRYNTKPIDGYYQCRIIKKYPLDNIPEFWIDECNDLLEKNAA